MLESRRGKLIIVGVVVALGIVAAIVFRRPSKPEASGGDAESSIALRDESAESTGQPPPEPKFEGRIEPLNAEDTAGGASAFSSAAGRHPAAIGAGAPELDERYPETDSPYRARDKRPGPTPLDDLGIATAAARRTHKVRDGDTLSELAQRYLNDSSRYLEIYELNRDVLESPELLPISAELRIPPAGTPAAPRIGSNEVDTGPLVPLRRNPDGPAS